MLLLKLANKIVSKQIKSQREDMTDLLIYHDINRCYQNIRMTYYKNRTRYIAHNVINNDERYDKKVNLTVTKVPLVITISENNWEPIHNGVGHPYRFTYRIEDGDRETIYNFKGLPTFIAGKDEARVTEVMINNSKTGVWLTMECKDNRPRLLLIKLEKISIGVTE